MFPRGNVKAHQPADHSATVPVRAEVAKAAQPKLVRDLIAQRIGEAQHEAKRLNHLLDTSPAALLDCTLDQAAALFGNGV